VEVNEATIRVGPTTNTNADQHRGTRWGKKKDLIGQKNGSPWDEIEGTLGGKWTHPMMA